MSIYVPKPGTMTVKKRDDGWWVDDAYGPFDGPYATADDAWAVLHHIEEENNDFRAGC